MLKKGILLLAVFTLLAFSTADARRRDIVVPTWYGYGVVSPQAVARPYITGYHPYSWPAYGYAGYYPASHVAPIATPFVSGAPAWNGLYWYYGAQGAMAAVAANLNIRAEPYVAGKKNKNANVIGGLKTGEHVYILGQTGNWSYIQSVYMPFRRGYVYSSYLRAYHNTLPHSHYTAFYPTAAYPVAYYR